VKDIPITIAIGIMKRSIDISNITDLQQRFLEYGEKIIKCSPEAGEELFEELLKLGLKEVTASQIIDISPSDISILKMLMSFEDKMPSNDVLEKILELVRDYCGDR